MKVYFSTSARYLHDSIEACRTIVDTVKQEKHTLTRDWIEKGYQENIQNHVFNEKEFEVLYEENIQALVSSDVVILEATADTFNNGYLSSKAVSLQKPLLILTSIPNARPIFISGETTSIVHVKYYSDLESLASIVSQFLRDNDNSTNEVRFNLYVGRNISNYLKRSSQTQGKTKAQVVRDIIEEHMSNRDYL